MGFGAHSKSWRHPLTPRLPASRYHIPASTPKIAAQTGNAQVASPESEESSRRPQRGPEHHLPHRTWTLDTGPGPGPGPAPDVSPTLNLRSVASRAKCWLADRAYVPAAGAGDVSTVSSCVAIVQLCLPFLSEFWGTTVSRLQLVDFWTVKSE